MPSSMQLPVGHGHIGNGTLENGHTTNGDINVESYIIPDTLLGSRRPIKVIVIGFGMSGINLSYILSKQTKESNITLKFYERNPELGGTWFENIYPGCACDIPAINYQFTWHPSLEWTSHYATQKEILAYLRNAVSTHNLDSNVEYNHKVIGAHWEENKGQWKVVIQPHNDPDAAFDDYADVLINATGVLNNWKWPVIRGLDKFQNKIHTAAWDDSMDLTDKVVGVIGNGSSSSQVVPAIIDNVQHMELFVRSPKWIIQAHAPEYADEDSTNLKNTSEQMKVFSENPELYLAYRKELESEINPDFNLCIMGSKEQVAWVEHARKAMLQDLVKRPELAERLIPTYAVGCSRPIPNRKYLDAVTSDKCEISFSDIIEITEDGIITADGATHKLDVLICGTGFDVSYRPRFPVIGKDGLDLREAFSDSPDTYLSTMAPGFPNYFMVLGPYAPYSHGSIIPAIEAVGRHIALVLEKFQTQNIKSMTPKKEAVADMKQHREIYLKRTIWNEACRTWFKLGNNIMNWPGTRLHFIDILLNPRWEDYDWEYLLGNRYSYWGNGFTTLNMQEGVDKVWYIEAI